jgi:hypothetical protein
MYISKQNLPHEEGVFGSASHVSESDWIGKKFYRLEALQQCMVIGNSQGLR